MTRVIDNPTDYHGMDLTEVDMTVDRSTIRSKQQNELNQLAEDSLIAVLHGREQSWADADRLTKPKGQYPTHEAFRS